MILGILCKAPTSATNPSFDSPIENLASYLLPFLIVSNFFAKINI